MNKLKLITIGLLLFILGGCSGVTPRAGAEIGVGLGVDFTRKTPVIRPYIGGGIGAGLFKFF